MPVSLVEVVNTCSRLPYSPALFRCFWYALGCGVFAPPISPFLSCFSWFLPAISEQVFDFYLISCYIASMDTDKWGLLLLLFFLLYIVTWPMLKRVYSGSRSYGGSVLTIPAPVDRTVQLARITIIATDAGMIVHRKAASLKCTRRSMLYKGMSEKRYNEATYLLRQVGALPPRGSSLLVDREEADRRVRQWEWDRRKRTLSSPSYVLEIG